jgi:hypothetical protein
MRLPPRVIRARLEIDQELDLALQAFEGAQNLDRKSVV